MSTKSINRSDVIELRTSYGNLLSAAAAFPILALAATALIAVLIFSGYADILYIGSEIGWNAPGILALLAVMGTIGGLASALGYFVGGLLATIASRAA